MAKKKQRETEAAREPGFFSDSGYGQGTALTVLPGPTKPKGGKKPAKAKRK